MATNKGHRIGEMLLDEGIITKEQLQECLQEQKVTSEKVGEVMVRKGYVTHEVLMAFLGTQMGVPYVSLSEMQNIPSNLLKLLPEQLMRTQHVIPLAKKGNLLMLAMLEPTNVFMTDDIKVTTRCDLDLRFSSEKEIKAALDKYFGFKEEDAGELVKASASDETFGGPGPSAPSKPTVVPAKPTSAPAPTMTSAPTVTAKPAASVMSSSSMESAANAAASSMGDPHPATSAIPTANLSGGDTPVINFLTSVLVEATKVGASDIHFEPYEKTFRIRWRIDGTLQEVQSPPRTLANALATRLKTMAEMDTKTKSSAQQGKMKIKIPGRDVSMSILIAPTMWGEKIVMHLINTESVLTDLDKLGMEPGQYELYRRMIQQPYGLILLVGPKASGKTATAYATLQALNQPTKNLSAVDEAVDFSLPGVNQVVVNESRGITYVGGVRAMLDQDSDILLVGELHDAETTRLILDAVPTGHLVLSTLHANDPVIAVQYIANMGVEPYVLAAGMTGIVNQRLVRLVCNHCKETYEAPAEISKYLGMPAGKKATLSKGKGCDQCARTGYHGRQAVFEVIPIVEPIREAIIGRAPSATLRKAISEIPGFISLKAQVAKKVAAGITSYEELVRVAS